MSDCLRLGSLFSGAGLLDLAIEEAFGEFFGVPVETVWVSDIDPGPVKVLAHRFPHAVNLGDITRIDWTAVEPVDLIGGGSPCQDISSAGRMAGMTHGTRSNLWTEMREAIRHLQPMFVVWENVQAARSTKAASRYWPDHIDRAIRHHLNVAQETRHDPTRARHRRAAHRLMEQRARRVGAPFPQPALRALGRVLGDLADLGYDAEWVSLPASGVGAPHLRWRYFIVAANARGQARLQRAGLRAGTAAEVGRGRPDHHHRQTESVALLPAPTTQDGANQAGPSQHRRDTPPLNVVATLLPTPSASLADHNRANGQDPEQRRAQGRQVSLADVARFDLALLPTPRATDGTKGGPNQRGSSGDLMLPSAVAQLPTPRATRGGSNTETVQLLPTPVAADARNARQSTAKNPRATNDTLSDVVHKGALPLLPTPSVADSMGGHLKRGGSRSDELLLKGIAAEEVWGPYAAAIARWEAIVGPAPPPTKPGKKGRPKLNPEFALWMMGVPEGWVTDAPSVTDNEALKIAGNGVVRQQAAEALRTCLTRFAESLGVAA